MESGKVNYHDHIMVTRSARWSVDEFDFQGLIIEGKNIRKESNDESAGTIRVWKLPSIIETQAEKLQQTDDEIRKLRNIIKEYDYIIKAIKGIQKESSQRKKVAFSRKGLQKRSRGSFLNVPEINQQKETPITQRPETVEN